MALETFLHDAWCIYLHDPNDSDWTHASYKLLKVVSSIEDFWRVWNAISPKVSECMFFFMREHVFPAWDDPSNINGCIASILVSRSEACGLFGQVVKSALGEYMNQAGEVNGVSISPKNGTNVIKVWLGEASVPDNFSFPVNVQSSNIQIKPCRQFMG